MEIRSYLHHLLGSPSLNVMGLVYEHTLIVYAHLYTLQVPSSTSPFPCLHLLPPLPTMHCHTHYLSSSSGVPNFSKYAPWRYRVEYSIDNGPSATEVITETFFSRSGLSADNHFTIHVIAEGQPGHSSTAPRFTVVTQSEGTGQAHVHTVHCTRAYIYTATFVLMGYVRTYVYVLYTYMYVSDLVLSAGMWHIHVCQRACAPCMSVLSHAPFFPQLTRCQGLCCWELAVDCTDLTSRSTLGLLIHQRELSVSEA